jgi:hypothetical protein
MDDDLMIVKNQKDLLLFGNENPLPNPYLADLNPVSISSSSEWVKKQSPEKLKRVFLQATESTPQKPFGTSIPTSESPSKYKGTESTSEFKLSNGFEAPPVTSKSAHKVFNFKQVDGSKIESKSQMHLSSKPTIFPSNSVSANCVTAFASAQSNIIPEVLIPSNR